MYNTIKSRLKEIEKERNIKILWAVESGSRSWGFDSPNSDFDVRFIYVESAEKYLQVNSFRDVIEIMDEPNNIDYSGWELRKALGLLKKHNPVLLEWLGTAPSDRYLTTTEGFALRTIAEPYFSVKSSGFHYFNLAKNNWHTYIVDKPNPIRKKYLYVLRGLINAIYCTEFDKLPPAQFDLAMKQFSFPSNIKAKVEQLIADKKLDRELGQLPADQELNDFIESVIRDLDTSLRVLTDDRVTDGSELDKFLFQLVVNDLAGSSLVEPPFNPARENR